MRQIVRDVCEELNKDPLCRSYRINLLATGWEDRGPAAGRPQELINKLVKEADIFVGILHKRFGSPTGKDESGTLEEFNLAYDLQKSLTKPHIMFYFKDITSFTPKDRKDPQLNKVLDFQEKIDNEKLLLYKHFTTPDDFEKKFKEHLKSWVVENASSMRQPSPQKREVTATVLEIPIDYRNWIINCCQKMDITKLMTPGRPISINLPEIFIPLYANPPARITAKEKDLVRQSPMKEKQEAIDIEKLVAGKEYLLIEGQAGSGKTTLLKHMAYTIIQENTDNFEGCLPVLIFLKDMPHIEDHQEKMIASADTAEKLLTGYFKVTGNGLSINLVKGFCQAGKSLFLIDGLDEIEPETRKILVHSLALFRARHRCKMVLSGRPHGMDEAVINNFGDTHTRINTLNNEQIETFIQKWFKYSYDISGMESKIGRKTAADMIGEIKEHPSVRELLETPLMLTAVCILYYDARELPGQRAELYKKFIDHLLYKRFGKEKEKVHDFMMTLAFYQHEKGERGFDKNFAVSIMRLVYARDKDETEAQYQKRLGNQFDYIEPNSGLLKFEAGQYSFWHLAFQEFLTATYITDYAKPIDVYWDNDWYKEVIELYVGYLSINNKKDAHSIIEHELNKPDNSTTFNRWRLAARAMLDIHQDRRQEPVLKLARERLISIFNFDNTPKNLADAGETLGWLSDTRADLEDFVAIEGGEYKLEGLGAVPIEPFEIGKYPVTNQWYEKFIQAGGYKNEEYWSEDGKKWLKESQAESPLYWHDRKWRCPNAPVVGVCWYEADAFCRWLTETLKDKKDKYVYQLPTEQQWQAAATSKEGREYPWGKWQNNRCNYAGAGIGKTTAVGIFLKGCTPGTDIADLSGNVWEWTQTDYNTKKSCSDFKIGKWGPVLRGGSWYGFQDNARCAFRFRLFPGDRGHLIGFRCSRTQK